MPCLTKQLYNNFKVMSKIIGRDYAKTYFIIDINMVFISKLFIIV